jgi:hypothetical protein
VSKATRSRRDHRGSCGTVAGGSHSRGLRRKPGSVSRGSDPGYRNEVHGGAQDPGRSSSASTSPSPAGPSRPARSIPPSRPRVPRDRFGDIPIAGDESSDVASRALVVERPKRSCIGSERSWTGGAGPALGDRRVIPAAWGRAWHGRAGVAGSVRKQHSHPSPRRWRDCPLFVTAVCVCPGAVPLSAISGPSQASIETPPSGRWERRDSWSRCRFFSPKGAGGVSLNPASTGSSLRGKAGSSDRSLTALGGRRRRQSRKWRRAGSSPGSARHLLSLGRATLV